MAPHVILITSGSGVAQLTMLRHALAGATAVLISVDEADEVCNCTAGCAWCERGTGARMGLDLVKDRELLAFRRRWEPAPSPPELVDWRPKRALESQRIAAALEPQMRRSQVHSAPPRRRPIRGAVPRSFGSYQGSF